MQFDETGLDRWTDEVRFTATRERLAEYAAATNDPIAAHLAGEVASPVFAIVPVFSALLGAGPGIVPLSLLGTHSPRRAGLPLPPPDSPGRRARRTRQDDGLRGAPNGTRACVYLETRDASGELVNEQYVTFFVRGFDDGRKLGSPSPEHPFAEALRRRSPVMNITQHVDHDQTFRYSPASGDPMPIHLEETVALDAGLPGIIAHGFCMLAFTSWAILTQLADGDVSRLRRLAVRFAKPVLPGQDITTRVWESGPGRYAFETTVDETVVLRDGLAELTG